MLHLKVASSPRRVVAACAVLVASTGLVVMTWQARQHRLACLRQSEVLAHQAEMARLSAQAFRAYAEALMQTVHRSEDVGPHALRVGLVPPPTPPGRRIVRVSERSNGAGPVRRAVYTPPRSTPDGAEAVKAQVVTCLRRAWYEEHRGDRLGRSAEAFRSAAGRPWCRRLPVADVPPNWPGPGPAA